MSAIKGEITSVTPGQEQCWNLEGERLAGSRGQHRQHVLAGDDPLHHIELAGTPRAEAELVAHLVEALSDDRSIGDFLFGEGQSIDESPGIGTGNGVDPGEQPVVEIDIEVAGDRLVPLAGVGGSFDAGRSGKAAQERLAVRHGLAEPLVQHDGSPNVGRGADETADALYEAEHGGRHHVVGERVVAPHFEGLDAGMHDGVVGRVERELLDDEE